MVNVIDRLHPSAKTLGKARTAGGAATSLAARAYVPYAVSAARHAETIHSVNNLVADLDRLYRSNKKYIDQDFRKDEPKKNKHHFRDVFEALEYIIGKLKRKTRHVKYAETVDVAATTAGLLTGAAAGSFVPGAGTIAGGHLGAVSFGLAGTVGVFIARGLKKGYKASRGQQGRGRKNAANILIRFLNGNADIAAQEAKSIGSPQNRVASKAVQLIFDALYPFHSVPYAGERLSYGTYDFYFRRNDHNCGRAKSNRDANGEECQKCVWAEEALVELLKSW